MKYDERLKLVREALDFNVMAQVCMASEDDLKKYGDAFHENEGKGKFAFYFKDNGSDILAIAHMDSVQKGKDFGIATYVSGREVILSPTLDDRLGVYVICELLPKLGITTNILLTTDEESGRSTASKFVTDKQYRWMFQFDRAGDDVVMYQYKTEAAFKKLTDCGFRTATGSASDISKLDDLGCLGFNFGVGYEDYHYASAYANVRVLVEQVAKFMKFHKQYHREFMVYEKTKHVTTVSESSNHQRWDGYGGGYTGGFGSNYETDGGRRVDGVWMSKTVWNEIHQMYLPSGYLYKQYPDTQLLTVAKLVDMNEKWSHKEQKFVFCDGKSTEAEMIALAESILSEAMGKSVSLPLGTPRTQWTPSTDKSKSGSDSNVTPTTVEPPKPVSEGLYDDPCMCSHSRYVHTRPIFRAGITSMTGCDFWKCNCQSFHEALSTHSREA